MPRQRSQKRKRSSASTSTRRARTSLQKANDSRLKACSGQLVEALGTALVSVRPPPPLGYSDWAEWKRTVPVGTSAEPGPWKSRPWQVAVFEALEDPASRGTLFAGCSQLAGKTEVILTVVGYHVEHDPGPVLIVEPDLDMADALSQDRVAPMIDESPAIRAKVGPASGRSGKNKIRHKVFPGGHLTLVGANSPSGLAMRPIRILVCDEIDRYKPTAGKEGNPLRIAEKRTVSFWNARKLYVTSPGTKLVSESWKLWVKSDKQEWFVTCPDCGVADVLKWTQVRWDRDADGKHLPETAEYACEHCGSCWDDVRRWRAANAGEMRATQEFTGIHGLRFGALNVSGQRLSDMAQEWLDAQGDPDSLQVFINTVLCEWWDHDDVDEVDETGLMSRREDWSLILPVGTELPQGVAVLTLGVDAQKDRLEYEVIGWGHGEESWSIEYGKLYGNVKEDPSVLADLDKLLDRAWVHAKGLELFIRGACIDTGYATQAVYRYCRPRMRRPLPNGQPQFVFAIKGRSEYGRPVWPETAASKRTKTSSRVNLWTIGVDAGKDQVMARLGIAEPGPGYCHFPLTRNQDYFIGLTAEHAKTVRQGGKTRRVWEVKRSGLANEPFDCRNYGYAAIVGLQSWPFLLDLDAECRKIETAPDAHDGARAAQPSRPARPNERQGMLSRGYV